MAVAMNVDEMSSRIIQLAVDSGVTKAELLDFLRQMHMQKLEVIDAINVKFAQIRNRIDIIIHDTARELNELKAGQTSSYNDLFSRTKAAVDNFEDRMSGLESRGSGGPREGQSGGGGVYKGQGYLPLKSTIPEQMGKEPEEVERAAPRCPGVS